MPATEETSRPNLTDDEFTRSTEPLRRELFAHCYRMLGSVDDAEDVLQETYLRAWRSYGGFEGRASVRTWLYRIATNACLTAMSHRSRRVLPSGLGAPNGTGAELPAGVEWLQPAPDILTTGEEADPAELVATRASVRLALVAGLQYLPRRQRAVLLLRDVLALPATEVAGVHGMSVPAVKSALQRARRRIAEVAPDADRLAEPSEARERELLDGYMAAFTTADASALVERLLTRDAVLEVSPSAQWFSGKAVCGAVLQAAVGTPGEWRMVPTRANGQPAAYVWQRGTDGAYHPSGMVVLTVTQAGITRITVFAMPELVTHFQNGGSSGRRGRPAGAG
jgi:RNA polymerase sigma-70 factor (ECF subfamily)